jgi:chromosome segregation ATPase
MDMTQATEILTVLRRMEREATQFQAFVVTRFEGIDNRLASLEKASQEAAKFQAAALERFEAIDRRLDGIDRRLDAIDQRLDGIDRRFDAVERQIDRKNDGLRTELVDHMERIHRELDLRVRDVETAPPRKVRARG